MSELIAKNLEKKYKQRKVVRNVSLRINSGEIVGLLGPNGAGKTTSFYIIVGLIKANSGSILIDNTEITMLPIHERAKLGISYLPQEPSIFRKLSVTDNIMAILELREELNKSQRYELLDDLLKKFHLEHLANNIGISLSGGERRRVEIARALATSPKFILLDEPFAGIDPISIIDIKNIIAQLQKLGIGILVTDHNVKETLNICQMVYIINDGVVIAEGDPQAILNNKKVREVYLGKDFS